MKVTLLSGISGSGKSTYAKEKKITDNRVRAEVISADTYFIQNGIYTYDASKIAEAHNACIRAFIEICGRGFIENLFVDNTNTTALELAPYVAIASAYRYEIELITFHADAVKCAERNTHGVSLQTCLQMQANLNVRELPSYWNITSIEFNRF